MRIRGILAAAAVASLIVLASMLAAAAPASANQVWYQSISRGSENAACPSLSQADVDAGWSPWASSWEQWSNSGKGGYVCSRSITWAYDEPAPVVTCTLIFEGQYVLLDPSGFFPDGTIVYGDELCSNAIDTANSELGFAFTDAGQSAADAICTAASPALDPAPYAYPVAGSLYICSFSD